MPAAATVGDGLLKSMTQCCSGADCPREDAESSSSLTRNERDRPRVQAASGCIPRYCARLGGDLVRTTPTPQIRRGSYRAVHAVAKPAAHQDRHASHLEQDQSRRSAARPASRGGRRAPEPCPSRPTRESPASRRICTSGWARAAPAYWDRRAPRAARGHGGMVRTASTCRTGGRRSPPPPWRPTRSNSAAGGRVRICAVRGAALAPDRASI
jgi:hypothetical protein